MIFPMAAYVFYMFSIAVLMFLNRFQSIKSGQIKMKYFRTFQGSEIPDRVALVGRHYDNQFQVPVLFLITCVSYIALGKADHLSVSLASIFVATRFFHSFVHLGSNDVRIRASVFFLGWMAILAMWVQLLGFAL